MVWQEWRSHPAADRDVSRLAIEQAPDLALLHPSAFPVPPAEPAAFVIQLDGTHLDDIGAATFT